MLSALLAVLPLPLLPLPLPLVLLSPLMPVLLELVKESVEPLLLLESDGAGGDGALVGIDFGSEAVAGGGEPPFIA